MKGTDVVNGSNEIFYHIKEQFDPDSRTGIPLHESFENLCRQLEKGRQNSNVIERAWKVSLRPAHLLERRLWPAHGLQAKCIRMAHKVTTFMVAILSSGQVKMEILKGQLVTDC